MRPNPVLRAALWPASLIFGGAVRLRERLYRSGVLRRRRLDGIVISVGNLTLGGTGKTPMVIWLAQRLAGEGRRAGILTRGYRALFALTAEGNDRGANPGRVSDEVLVLRSHLGENFPIGVGADRYREGVRLRRQGVECFILDDGFQHLCLERDVDIVLLDATSPFDTGALLPAGGLREPPSALGRADLVVITRSASAPELEARVHRATLAPIFYAQTELMGLFRIHPEPAARAEEHERAQRFFAFCGTGNPDAFFDDLRRWQIKVVGEAAFPDHHLYRQRDAGQLERFAREANAQALVSTEKDIPNFRGVRFEALPVFACRMGLRPTRPEALWQAIATAIERKAAGKSP